MPSKKAYHVDPYCKVRRTATNFCNEPQALVNICLTCPLPTCIPDSCKRYKIAKLRLEFGIFPLVDVEVVKIATTSSKCERCEFGCDVGGKVFCPLVRGTCVKEEF